MPQRLHPPGSIDALRADYRELLSRLEANHQHFQRLVRAGFRAQEAERQRLARDLHDGIGQNLTALKHRLGLLLEGQTRLPAPAREAVQACIGLCADTLADTRQISRLLRPQVLDDLGLEAALRWLARTVGQAGGLGVECDLAEIPVLDGERQTVVFRIGQEALANALKHSGARRAGLRLAAHGHWLQLEVWDDGCGFDAEQGAVDRGTDASGLAGMRDRAQAFGGRLHIDSAPGRGTRLRLMLPATDAVVASP